MTESVIFPPCKQQNTVILYYNQTGIQTSQDAKFYGLSAKFDEPFSNEGKTLVVQFQVKHEQSIDCGGGYVKVLFNNILFSKDVTVIVFGDSDFIVSSHQLKNPKGH